MPSIGKPCRECGKIFSGKRPLAVYCSGDCRQAFSRRRRDRGAELYDFVLANEASTVKRLVQAYRDADATARAGRPSWIPSGEAILNIPVGFGREGDKR